MKRKYFMISMMAMFMLTACGTTEKQEVAEDNTVEAAETHLEGEGVFIGLIDANSFEIETSEGPLILRFSEELSEKIQTIAEGSKVKYTYKKNDEKQNILTAIDVL